VLDRHGEAGVWVMNEGVLVRKKVGKRKRSREKKVWPLFVIKK